MKQNPLRLTFAVMMMAAATMSAATDATAQESGTLLFQTATVKKDATVPVFRFKVASGKPAFWPVDILLEIGPEGNATTPPADPALPAGLVFRIKRIDVAGEVTFPLAGGSSPGIPSKLVAVTRGLEVPPLVGAATTPAPQGLFAIQVLANTGTSANEQWEVHVENLPGSWRIIASISGGFFNGVAPAPAACGSGTVCTPCAPCNCAFRKCLDFRYYVVREIVRPPIPEPDCPMCLAEWKVPYDRSQFERILVTYVPTRAQRASIEKVKDIQFNISGGEGLGEIREGGSGEFIQMVQHPIGKPPMITVVSAGTTLDSFRAEPPSANGGASRNFAYGLGGLVLGALGSFFGIRRRPAGPGTNRMQ